MEALRALHQQGTVEGDPAFTVQDKRFVLFQTADVNVSIRYRELWGINLHTSYKIFRHLHDRVDVNGSCLVRISATAPKPFAAWKVYHLQIDNFKWSELHR